MSATDPIPAPDSDAHVGCPSVSGSGLWTSERPANHVLPCPPDWLVEVEHYNGSYTVAKAKDIRWGGRPHASHLEVKEWRVLERLPHSEEEREYALRVHRELEDLFGFSPVGELAELIEEALAAALDRVSLLIDAAISSPNSLYSYDRPQ